MPRTQGNLANSSGNTLEQIVVATMQSKGFEFVRYKDYVRAPENHSKELLLKDAPYVSIYGHNAKTEFLISSEEHSLKVRVECKWQQSSGSVHEKFPYLYLNCIEQMPEKDIFIVVGGQGAKQYAIDWLIKAARLLPYAQEHAKHKQIKVLTIEEFTMWANKTIR
jgi:hypothetical protein